MHLYNIFFNFYIVSVHSFFIFFFNLVSINWTEWSTIPACPSLMCALLTGVMLKGLILRKFVSDVCVCMFYVCEVIGFVD